MEYMIGGDLFFNLKKSTFFSEEIFYQKMFRNYEKKLNFCSKEIKSLTLSNLGGLIYLIA